MRPDPPPEWLERLSPRKQQVARLVAAGHTDKQIAAMLGLACKTVRMHVVGIARAWGLDHERHVRVQIAHRVFFTGDRRSRSVKNTGQRAQN